MLRTFLVVAVILSSGIAVTLGVERIESPRPDTIQIGTSIDAVQRVVREAKLQEGGRRDASFPPDRDYLYYAVEPSRVCLMIVYSKMTRDVKQLTLTCCHEPRCKLNEVHVSARSIRFCPDGSYVVHFERPAPSVKSRAQSQQPPHHF
jgi:hypothetical protein